MSLDADVLTQKTGCLGLITLNRPAKLNTLTLGMCRTVTQALRLWANDPQVKQIAITGSGDKAFCAGGDVKAVSQDLALAKDFFREEYQLNYLIDTYPKPYIALLDGIVMGGGVGVSAHGSHRIVTQKTLLAMPETAIGLFPDVGGGYLLSRCPGELGTFLALTGQRIKAADIMHCALATHMVDTNRLNDFISLLTKQEISSPAFDEFYQAVPPAPLADKQAQIDKIFAADDIETIMHNLEQQMPDIYSRLLKFSPTSLKITLRQLRLAKNMSLNECLKMEYRMSQACMRHHDFAEGVRAMLIDKDHSPNWQPPYLKDVDENLIQDHFKPAEHELDLLNQKPAA